MGLKLAGVYTSDRALSGSPEPKSPVNPPRGQTPPGYRAASLALYQTGSICVPHPAAGLPRRLALDPVGHAFESQPLRKDLPIRSARRANAGQQTRNIHPGVRPVLLRAKNASSNRNNAMPRYSRLRLRFDQVWANVQHLPLENS